MFTEQINKSIECLRYNGYFITAGLTTQELNAAEECYNITFPADYKAFLSVGMPLYRHDFTDWRNLSAEYVEYIKFKMYDCTIDGVLYAVRKLDGWPESWGKRPDEMEGRLALARKKIKENPLFIPIKSNRYLSLSPAESGNPVYSIHEGDDVVCYGENLWDYFIKSNDADGDGDGYGHADAIYNLTTMLEPFPKYNTFVYHSINNFFYQNQRYYDECGNYLPGGEAVAQ
ncbi:SMI1/KNR4 family protein [Superficieibacter electus]|uniref:SMI1/KNR4 family protein n=1 Tax=Superficieibacter electus TaxID=2022662 RepID=A0A2P5GPF4_9ENTR|nr:SMI1/KNR4 family protein [Superficieibacter electus]POP45163.1 SMI1/KNR4 family protein [Superficieibacter electus]POP48447.1 SMI1/KNR4 family protein [Superficieibacter electus]